MTDLELDEILTLRWPSVVRRVMGDVDAGDFAKSFVRSISRHGKRQSWQPSDKQARLMHQLLTDYGPGYSRDAEPELIERD